MKGNVGVFFAPLPSSSSEGYVDGKVEEAGVGFVEETGVEGGGMAASMVDAFRMLKGPCCFFDLTILQGGGDARRICRSTKIADAQGVGFEGDPTTGPVAGS